jgi:hypothetical protein
MDDNTIRENPNKLFFAEQIVMEVFPEADSSCSIRIILHVLSLTSLPSLPSVKIRVDSRHSRLSVKGLFYVAVPAWLSTSR